ncbi:hypothetical protein Patl_2299 [Paraglaciecola sp. T6c]|uniref:hypothetical protein n=1 Tax=Pseudoalteromonas atlantica (strain T6c / ATCC BAA-1087) TaxID=3042615 RepID=UPI00005C5AC6|nr:hypothetical protein [Paraglaciecola sp. T6c]ABG40816.1 hypothetical protein Patl_2299 [Paraglaciecola sp. T6c]
MELSHGHYSIVLDEHIVTISLTDNFNQTSEHALVVPSGAVRKINDPRILVKANQNARSFDNVPDALVWLKKEAAISDKPEN